MAMLIILNVTVRCSNASMQTVKLDDYTDPVTDQYNLNTQY